MEILATFIEQAGAESLERFQAHSRKAKVSVAEVRDTADPALITQVLSPLLEARLVCTPGPCKLFEMRMRTTARERMMNGL